MKEGKVTHIAFDTEFAGFVRKGPISFYEQLRLNIQSLKLIQLGVTISDKQTEKDEGFVKTWQFNFKFDKENDPYQPEAMEVLDEAGLDFAKHKVDGISHEDF
jgi:CCR4-NOT transcription complex subunit 7/8